MTILGLMITTLALLWVNAEADCPRGCVCRASTSVEELKCHDTDLTSIPSGLSSSVVRIDLANNSLEVLDVSQLRFLQRPAEVVLRKNRIHRIVDSDPRPTPLRIQILVLSHNRLQDIGGILRLMTDTLVQLDLSHNDITSVEGELVDLTHLSRLDLRHNRLTEVKASTFHDLVNLRYLRLEDNHIASISADSFLRLENLSYLVLKGNPIGTSADQLVFNFTTSYLSYVDLSECRLLTVPSGFPSSVRYLQLRKNRLTAIVKEDFRVLVKLEILILDDNQISDVEAGAFENLRTLSQLWISNNRLESVPLRLPSNVQRLLLDTNQIHELASDSFTNLSQLQTLSLMGNSISRIDERAFRITTQLGNLDLSANNLSRIIPGTFVTCSRLQVLHLSKNPLQSLERGSFDGLTHLDELIASYVPPMTSSDQIPFSIDAMTELRRLSRLDLDGSTDVIRALTTSGSSMGDALIGLRELSLMKSDLTDLGFNLFSNFPGLISLRISSDRWRCDRSLLWLRNWLLSNSSIPLDDNRCLTPDHVTGRPLTSLEEWEFADNTVAQNQDKMNPTDGPRHQDPESSIHFPEMNQTNHSEIKPLRSYTLATTRHHVDSKGSNDENRRTRKAKGRQGHTTRPGLEDFPGMNGFASGTSPMVNTPKDFSQKPSTESQRKRITEASDSKTPSDQVLEESKQKTSPGKQGHAEDGHEILSSSVSSRTLVTRNWTGSDFRPPGNDATASNLTSEYADDEIDRDFILTTDFIITIGTIAGTIVTASVMIGVIVYLCRKDKTERHKPTVTNSIQAEDKVVTPTVQSGRQEAVHSTHRLPTETGGRNEMDGARKDSTGDRGRRISDGNRFCSRDPGWNETSYGRVAPAGINGSLRVDIGSEFASLMGQPVDGRPLETQIRVYKWEEL